MMICRMLRFAALAAVLEATALLSPAQAEFGKRFWLSQVDQNAGDPEMAIDAQGNAIFVWKKNPGSVDQFRAQARQASAGGALGPILDLSTNGKDALGFPRVAVDGYGNAIFAWIYSDGSVDRVQGRTLSNTGVLGPVLELSNGGGDFDGPQVASDASGDVVFAWACADAGMRRAEARILAPDGTLGPLLYVSEVSYGNAFRPQLGIDDAGDAVLAWQVVGQTIRSRVISKTGQLGPVSRLAGQHTLGFELAVNRDGHAVLVWERQRSDGYRIKARTFSTDGAKGPVLNISSVSELAYDPFVAIDAGGGAVFTWRRRETQYRYQGRALSPSGVLGPVLDLSTDSPHRICQPRVTVDDDGNALFAWAQAIDDQYYLVQTRSLSPDGTLGPVHDLSKPGNDSFCVRIAVTADGAHAAAVWQARRSLQTTDFRIQGIMSR